MLKSITLYDHNSVGYYDLFDQSDISQVFNPVEILGYGQEISGFKWHYFSRIQDAITTFGSHPERQNCSIFFEGK